MVNGVDLEDLHIEWLALLNRVGRRLDFRDTELGHRSEPFEVVAKIHDDALVHESDRVRSHLGPDGQGLADLEPRVILGLLEPERDPLGLGVDVQHDNVHAVALLHYL